ncbi:hypothetical protein DFA_07784 [Cavenderia fasciculata]|uniref:Ras guanine nucleotide exchange factor glfB-like C-terminal domain-containing protein n=1 Tax=Cavenderia fasciculata TaxID=261658 RepID=F4Q3D7_CACFS|nr:uncharacterized protein DFA_07784 [Cavenderia fasciculata]EGG16806.1 hypothetical protein DFA_07784 [Cavenderia fasciculata]|eukprot:XP_004355280.1 hypothetical protein DFA_07784 [Cavenderia fasciculata]
MIQLQQSQETLDSQVNDLWKKKMTRLPIYKDLPRLAGRISITSTTDKSINYNPWTPETKTVAATPASTTSSSSSSASSVENHKEEDRKSLKLRLSCVELDKLDLEQDKLEILDNDTNNEKIFKRLKKIIFKMTECFEKSNLEHVKQVFNNYETPTDFELHMSTLLKGVSTIFNDKYDKDEDVRGPEGWRISIEETKDIVTVIHARREESLPTQPKDKQFWFEWQLTVILNKDLTEIESTSLKIVQLQFCEGISQAFKNEVSRALCSGNLFIC